MCSPGYFLGAVTGASSSPLLRIGLETFGLADDHPHEGRISGNGRREMFIERFPGCFDARIGIFCCGTMYLTMSTYDARRDASLERAVST